ncbi:MAG: LacI family DNA-binding transcriptional regulator [Erysipelotrichaceae bacterium]|nr:LacI family DNA-binding transcriptional regulator [Erysipelotrichaceae bacterium]
MKRVTIYDVARQANVSLATVSRVMNGSEVVKSATKQKVEEAIKTLGYKPNAIAQGLALQRTTTIGLIFPEESLTTTGQLINGLCDVAKIYDYNLYLHAVTSGINNMKEVIDEVIKSRVDGVVVYCNKALAEETKELDEYNIPMVAIGDRVSANSICSVCVDYEKAVYDLVNEYLDKGVKDIVILEDKRNKNMTKEMLNGAMKCYEERNMAFNGYLKSSDDEKSTFKFLKTYFKNHRHSLVIANRDSQALACLNACNENGVKVPEEVEIVCMNDTKYLSMVRPEISAFSIPTYDLGAVTMRLMTKLLKEDQEPVEDKQRVLGYIYQERKTTK